jgi:hypothetical protein
MASASMRPKGAQTVGTANPVGSLREATRTMLQWQHRNLRNVVNSLPAEALNWTPAPGANSIAATVFHTLDGERELVAAAAGSIVEHDGAESFGFVATSAEELLAMIDRADWIAHLQHGGHATQ